MPTNSDINATGVFLVMFFEVVYGIGFNALIAWAHKNRLWHVSVSVAVGVFGTLVIPATVWYGETVRFWEACALLFVSFACSGIPMIVGSTRRTVNVKDRKKRRPWPNSALQARDDAIMELARIAHDIADQAKSGKLAVIDLPDYVNRIHFVIGTLKSA